MGLDETKGSEVLRCAGAAEAAPRGPLWQQAVSGRPERRAAAARRGTGRGAHGAMEELDCEPAVTVRALEEAYFVAL